jgi:hypothetical protein
MPLMVKHQVPKMLAQRIYGLAPGHEDLIDHEQLRSDPLLWVLSGKRELEEPLAGKSTLNQLELAGRTARYPKISYSATRSTSCWWISIWSRIHRAGAHRARSGRHRHPPLRRSAGALLSRLLRSYRYLPLCIFADDLLLRVCAHAEFPHSDETAGELIGIPTPIKKTHSEARSSMMPKNVLNRRREMCIYDHCLTVAWTRETSR